MPIVVDAELKAIILSTLTQHSLSHGPTSMLITELADRCGISERLARAIVKELPEEIKREDLWRVSLIPAVPLQGLCSNSAASQLNPNRASAVQSAVPLQERCSNSAVPPLRVSIKT